MGAFAVDSLRVMSWAAPGPPLTFLPCFFLPGSGDSLHGPDFSIALDSRQSFSVLPLALLLLSIDVDPSPGRFFPFAIESIADQPSSVAIQSETLTCFCPPSDSSRPPQLRRHKSTGAADKAHLTWLASRLSLFILHHDTDGDVFLSIKRIVCPRRRVRRSTTVAY